MFVCRYVHSSNIKHKRVCRTILLSTTMATTSKFIFHLVLILICDMGKTPLDTWMKDKSQSCSESQQCAHSTPIPRPAYLSICGLPLLILQQMRSAPPAHFANGARQPNASCQHGSHLLCLPALTELFIYSRSTLWASVDIQCYKAGVRLSLKRGMMDPVLINQWRPIHQKCIGWIIS